MEQKLAKHCNCCYQILRLIPNDEAPKAAEIMITEKARSCYHKEDNIVIWENGVRQMRFIPIIYPEYRLVSADWILSQATDAIVNGDAEPACEFDDDPVVGSALSLHDAGIITLPRDWERDLSQ